MDVGRYPKSLKKEPLMVYLVHAWQAAGFFIIWSHTFYMGKGDVGWWVVISDMTDDICELRSYATLQVMDVGRFPKSLRMTPGMFTWFMLGEELVFSLYGPIHFIWKKVS